MIMTRYLTNFLRFSAEVPRDLKHRLKVAQTIFKKQARADARSRRHSSAHQHTHFTHPQGHRTDQHTHFTRP